MKIETNKYTVLLENIGNTLITGRNKANKAINVELLKTKWEIGHHIIEYEQEGNETAEYGSDLLNKLSKDLKLRYGKGFSRRNVLDMRRFYVSYSNWQTVSANLSWSHYVELLGIKNELERKFYEKQCLHEGWSIREFQYL